MPSINVKIKRFLGLDTKKDSLDLSELSSPDNSNAFPSPRFGIKTRSGYVKVGNYDLDGEVKGIYQYKKQNGTSAVIYCDDSGDISDGLPTT